MLSHFKLRVYFERSYFTCTINTTEMLLKNDTQFAFIIAIVVVVNVTVIVIVNVIVIVIVNVIIIVIVIVVWFMGFFLTKSYIVHNTIGHVALTNIIRKKNYFHKLMCSIQNKIPSSFPSLGYGFEFS